MTEVTPDAAHGHATDTRTAARLHHELFRSAPDPDAREQDRPMTSGDTEAAMVRLRTPFDTGRVDVVPPRRQLRSDADSESHLPVEQDRSNTSNDDTRVSTLE